MFDDEIDTSVDDELEAMLGELDELGFGAGDDLTAEIPADAPDETTVNEGNENENSDGSDTTEPETTKIDESKEPEKQTITVDILGEPTEVPVDKFKEMHTPPNVPQEELLFMKEHGISKEDLALLKDIKSGDEDAIAHLLKAKEIDPDVLDEKGDNYQPEFSVNTPDPLDMRIEEVMADPDLAKRASDVLDLMPDNVSQAMFSNRDVFDTFIHTVEDGSIQRVVRSMYQDNVPQYQFSTEFARRMEAHAQSEHEDPIQREQKAVDATDVGNTSTSDNTAMSFEDRYQTDKDFEDEFGSMDDYYI